MAKVEIERVMCISCGNCIDNCPEIFEYGDDGLSTLKDGEIVGDNVEKELENPGCAKEAEESCPVSIIHVYE
ncbi:MAG: ferredoxin [Methanobacterium sp.]|uniref:ferredoxin n=1 Tax=Methanobacterium sp. TaxID=2164 RepID=UPI003D65FE22|nr:ferredoxin [Methanobacterium sp.]